MSEPEIIRDWDSLPPNVIANGEEVSTRLLYKQHNDLKKALWYYAYSEACGQEAGHTEATKYADTKVWNIIKGT